MAKTADRKIVENMKNKEKYEKYSKDELQKLLDTSFSYSNFLERLDIVINSSSMRYMHTVINNYGLSEDKLMQNRKNNPNYTNRSNQKRSIEDYLVDGQIINAQILKNKLIKYNYKENRCEKCGIDSWMGRPISLQLHHIDGRRENNKLLNLELLCPNCHSQTDTYAGKNSNKEQKIRFYCKNCQKEISKYATYCRKCFSKSRIENPIVSRDNLKDLIRVESFVQIGKRFEVSDNTIRKWCKKYSLPTKSKDIKTYSDEEWKLI